MKALAQRTGLLVLLIAVGLLPACSKKEPPATQPTVPVATTTPAPTREAPAEAPEAGAWTGNEPSSDILTLDDINRDGYLKTIYFDFDKAEIRADQRATLQANAQFLRENPGVRILIAGHSDERGTREYNMALGERRASATMQYLVSLGVPRDRIEIISYGEEQPAVMGSGESAWALNRRAAFQAIAAN